MSSGDLDMTTYGTVIFHTRRIAKGSAYDYLRGLGSAFNIAGSTRREYDLAHTADEADRRALEDDWKAVGGDMHNAVESYDQA